MSVQEPRGKISDLMQLGIAHHHYTSSRSSILDELTFLKATLVQLQHAGYDCDPSNVEIFMQNQVAGPQHPR